MRYFVVIILLHTVFCSCIKERYYTCVEENTLGLEMKPVPYLFQGDSTIGYLPYYQFVKQLDLLLFKDGQQDTGAVYDYEYCLEHPVIPLQLEPGIYNFLFVGNLLDHKNLVWRFTDEGRLEARLSIADHREPPLYLISVDKVSFSTSTVLPIQLHLLISRIEIKLINPPNWINSLDFSVRNIAREITDIGELSDTTSIYKTIGIDYSGPGTYYVGMNAFPTYPGHPAVVDIKLKGENRVSQYVIEDSRMELQISRILQIEIEFETENDIKVSIKVNDKWEVVDEGKIEI